MNQAGGVDFTRPDFFIRKDDLAKSMIKFS